MKLLLLLFTVSLSLSAQETNYNVKNGCGVGGYDVVAYFKGTATKGSSKYEYTYDKIRYKFSSKENLEKFKLSPKDYLPQYGGWCAYAMGKKGKKVDMDPITFEIRDGKLYLFYTSFFTDAYKKWLDEGPEKLKKKADKKWKKYEKNN